MTDRFPPHTTDTATGRARSSMAAVERELGFLPDAVARMAAAPPLLETFLRATAQFEAATLDPLARETVVMALADRAGCHVCRAMHTARLRALGADPSLERALRDGGPLPDTRLEAVRRFTLSLAADPTVDRAAVSTFLEHGFTEANALEIVLGVGAYTMSTLANAMTGAEVDEPLRAFA